MLVESVGRLSRPTGQNGSALLRIIYVEDFLNQGMKKAR